MVLPGVVSLLDASGDLVKAILSLLLLHALNSIEKHTISGFQKYVLSQQFHS